MKFEYFINRTGSVWPVTLLITCHEILKKKQYYAILCIYYIIFVKIKSNLHVAMTSKVECLSTKYIDYIVIEDSCEIL